MQDFGVRKIVNASYLKLKSGDSKREKGLIRRHETKEVNFYPNDFIDKILVKYHCKLTFSKIKTFYLY